MGADVPGSCGACEPSGHAVVYARERNVSAAGGIQYAKHIVEFRMKMYRYQVITFGEFLPMTVARVLVSLMPNGVRKYLYDKKLRKHK